MRSSSVSDAHSEQSHDSVLFWIPVVKLTQPEPRRSEWFCRLLLMFHSWPLHSSDMIFSSRQKVTWLVGSSAARLTTALLFVSFTRSSWQTDNRSFHKQCGSDQAFTSADGKFQLHTQRCFLHLSISSKPLTCTNTDEESPNNSYCNSDSSWEESVVISSYLIGYNCNTATQFKKKKKLKKEYMFLLPASAIKEVMEGRSKPSLTCNTLLWLSIKWVTEQRRRLKWRWKVIGTQELVCCY